RPGRQPGSFDGQSHLRPCAPPPGAGTGRLSLLAGPPPRPPPAWVAPRYSWPMVTADLDRLLAPEYLGDLQARPVEEIRAMREECQRAEDSLSFLRRVVHSRLDIVAAEQARRAEGLEPSDPSTLVEKLPEILGHNVVGPGL